ncbi:MAG: hypothetical protein LBG31_03435 [Prevotellaceae bacterium]|nr:hypothetical protein [Prevotellaceae bacterium]
MLPRSLRDAGVHCTLDPRGLQNAGVHCTLVSRGLQNAGVHCTLDPRKPAERRRTLYIHLPQPAKS